MTITVNQVMTGNPLTLVETDTLVDAWKLMHDKGIQFIPIVNPDQQYVGLFTQGQILDLLCADFVGDTESALTFDDADLELQDLMITGSEITTPATSVRLAAGLLRAQGCLPVIDEDVLVGILTEANIVEFAIGLLQREEATLFADSEAENDLDNNELEGLEELYGETTEDHDWTDL